MIWIWPQPEKRYLPAILEHVTSSCGSSDIKVLSFEAGKPLVGGHTQVTKYLLSQARAGLLPNFYTTFLNSRDCLAIFQLCLAQLHKQKDGEFIAPSEQILKFYKLYASGSYSLEEDQQSLCSQTIAEYLETCRRSNCVDQWQLCKLLTGKMEAAATGNLVLLGMPDSREFLGPLLGLLQPDSPQIHQLSVEIPLDSSMREDESLQVTSTLLDHWRSMVEGTEVADRGSRVYIQEVALASLQLLVNSRSELAPARLMGSPLLELDHSAFTALKQASAAARLPLCHMATSYVYKKKLGGKGYQPKEDYPLNPHFPALVAFTDYFDVLQTIREDEPDPGPAIAKIVGCIRKKLLRNNAGLKREVIEEVFTELQETAQYLDQNLVFNEEEVKAKTTGYGHKTLLLMRELVDLVSCSLPCPLGEERFLSALRSGQVTTHPRHLPTVFSLFRSPVPPPSSAKVPDICIPPLPEIPIEEDEDLPPSPEVAATMAVVEKENIPPTPPPSMVSKQQPAKSSKSQAKPIKRMRRKLDMEAPPSKKSRGKKPLSLVQGQTCITSFFNK